MNSISRIALNAWRLYMAGIRGWVIIFLLTACCMCGLLLQAFGVVSFINHTGAVNTAAVLPEADPATFCYVFDYSDVPGDSADSPYRSRLVLREDGVPLPFAHAQHADIRTIGKGRYSHWGGYVLFSTSDNSDPRTNRRNYCVSFPRFTSSTARLTILAAFGVALLGLLASALLAFLKSCGIVAGQTGSATPVRVDWAALIRGLLPACRPLQAAKPYTRKQLLIALFVLLAVGGCVHTMVALGGPLIILPDSGFYIVFSHEIKGGTLDFQKMPLERVPGYGLFILGVKELFGADSGVGLKLAQHFLGLMVNLMIFLCVLMLTRGRLYCALAAGLFSLASLQALAFQNIIMTETLYMFLIGLCITAYIYAMTSRRDMFFAVAMAVCATSAWVRPIGRLLWFALIAHWIVWLLCRFWQASADKGTLAGRLRSALRQMCCPKPWLWLLVGIMSYIALISPQLIMNYKRMGKLTLGSGEGLTLWHGVFFYHKLDNYENPEFAKFVEDFNAWYAKGEGVPKLYKDLGMDWRHCYFAACFLHGGRGMEPHEYSAWMLKMCQDAIAQHPFKYIGRVLLNVRPQLTIPDSAPLFVFGAEEVRERYPWALDASQANQQYLDTAWVTDFFNISSHDSVLKPLNLAVSDVYNRIFRSTAHQNFVWWMTVWGVLAGFLLFKRMAFLLVLGIIAYQILLPLLAQYPIARFRFPVYALQALVMVAGPWVAGLLCVRILTFLRASGFKVE